MKTALIATLLLVTWPPNWTPNGRQIIESVAYREKIGSFTITARYDVYNDGTVVTILSHEDISRPIIVLLPTTNRFVLGRCRCSREGWCSFSASA